MAKRRTPKIYDPRHKRKLEAMQLKRYYNPEREERRKAKRLKALQEKQAIIDAYRAEYNEVLGEIRRLQNYLASTSNNSNDSQIIETYMELLNKKYAIEQSGKIPSILHVKNVSPKQSLQIVNATIRIEWQDVVFSNGKMAFRYGEKYFDIVVTNAKEAFNKLIPTFAKRLPAIEIEIKHSIASIVNAIDFDNIIELLQWCQTIFHIEDGKKTRVKISTLNRIPTKLIKQIFHYSKTEYLNYLQDKQDENVQIIPVFEKQGQNPDGFLFTINRGREYLIVWESNQEMANKATYIFQSPANQLHNIQQLLFDYIYSDIHNKRHNLRANKVREFLGFNYKCIDHDNFSSWANLVENSFKKDTGIKKKNESSVSYHINQERRYIPTHNIIQNKLKTYLEGTGYYTEVLLESDNVDIKAVTFSGEWHYFELKTSAPRQCIREALGQILEYAHYPFDNRAKKLYIVGCYALSENEVKYMNLLRTIYNMPIWYRWFDDATNCLSEDY